MRPFSIPNIVMAAVCFTIALYELSSLRRRGLRGRDVAFALTCLGGTFYNLACAGEYNVGPAIDSIPWLRAQAISLNLTGFAFLWFIAGETGLVKRRYLIAFGAWCVIAVLSQVFDLGDLAWVRSRPFELAIRLPFDIAVQYKEVEAGPIVGLLNIEGLVFLGYLLVIAHRFGRKGSRHEARALLWSLAIFAAVLVNDFAVGLGLYSFVFLTEYGWLMTILIFGLRRANEILEAATIRRALIRSEEELRESQATLSAIVESTFDMIWSVDSESFGLLTFNESMRAFFSRQRKVELAVGIRPEEMFPIGEYVKSWRALYERALAEGSFSIEYSFDSGSTVLQLGFNLIRRDGKVFGISVFGKDITERRQAEERVEKSLEEKETLLRELYHRTKNNMNVIISMLKLQSNQIDDPRLQAAFAETEDRILSMALVHEMLYETHDLTRINLKDYVEDIARNLVGNCGSSGLRLSLTLKTSDVFVAIDSAISCGLIVNELVTNSLKYAFPSEGRGEIRIGLSQQENADVSLTVSDDGRGLPEGFDPERDGQLGLRLIFSLAKGKLRASVEFESDHGVSCRVRFKNEPAGRKDGDYFN